MLQKKTFIFATLTNCQQLLLGLQNLGPPPQTMMAPLGSYAAHILPRASGRSGTPDSRHNPAMVLTLFSDNLQKLFSLPLGPIISIEVECSFSLFSLVVSPPSSMMRVVLSFSSGHTSCSAHTARAVASPSHVPTPGSFSRDLVLTPPPHVLLHVVQGPHSAH